MEVVSENSVSEVSLKSTPDIREEDENQIGNKVNGDMNGVSDGEMDVSQDDEERNDNAVEQNGVGDTEENGMDDVEPMETEDSAIPEEQPVVEDSPSAPEVCEVPASEQSDSNCEVTSDVRTCDETNGLPEDVNDEPEVVEPTPEEASDPAPVSETIEDDDEATQESKEVTEKPDDEVDEVIDAEKVPDEESCSQTSTKEVQKPDTPEKKGDSVSISLITPTKDSGEDDSCQEITPDKGSKKKKSQPITNVTPRRSSRNLNKTKSYADDQKAEIDDDIEEVSEPSKKNTIVVNDTKRLAEIAAVSKNSKGGKKEPTLVIIDTNSLMGCKEMLTQNSSASSSSNSSGRSWPVTVGPGAALFHSKSAVKVTAVPQQPQPVAAPPPPPVQAPAPVQKPVILPSLTDDMYVVEAPSFIVPYVYEKPPVNALKDFLKDLDKVIKEQEELKQKEEERKEALKTEKEKEEAEKNEREQSEKMEVDEVKEEKMEADKKEDEKEKEADGKDKKDTVEAEASDKEVKKEEKEKPAAKSDDDDVKVVGETKKDENIEVLEDKTNAKKSDSYFDNPLGKFFMQIGINLVQEYVQQDLLRNQMRKREREGKNCPADVHMAISSLTRTLESSKENNEPFKFELKKCTLCNFKTESQLVLAHHLETPHTRNFIYRCNFCEMECRSPHDILLHMETEHNVRGRLERTPAFHQCPNCPFEDNQKGKLSRHLLSCAKKYKPERNQEPPLEWEPPAKIPRVRGARGIPTGSVMYTPTASMGVRGSLGAPVPPLTRVPAAAVLPLSANSRARGRPPIYVQRYPSKTLAANIRSGMVFRPSSQPPVLLPAPYQLTTTPQLLSASNKSGNVNGSGAAAKLLQQPSISITPLPRGGSTNPPLPPVPNSAMASGIAPPGTKPGRAPGSNPTKTSFVICEICDGYIKDLEQLRNHMQWIHKVKIHPKMIYNRPPLNCQKCQFRFFTDQGLERHLLGSHGLVTSSMQEAANKGKDGGRCPVCGRVYQWKLLNHVARDHSMSLKPAHLSYKCTVCTATFGMYKQFENHVYSAHSVVAKKVTDKKAGGSSASLQPSTSGSSSPQVPLKINDEITIIPQPAKNKLKAVGSPSVTATKTSAK